MPDSEMLIKIAEVLETSVSEILGEAVSEKPSDGIKELAEKLESLNMQMAKITDGKRKSRRRRYGIIAVIALFIIVFCIIKISFNNQMNDAIGIIGGADGPTSIFITGVFPPYELIALIAGVVLVISAFGIYINRRK